MTFESLLSQEQKKTIENNNLLSQNELLIKNVPNMRVLLEDGSIKDLLPNYTKVIYSLLKKEKYDDNWLYITEDHVYFVTRYGKALPLLLINTEFMHIVLDQSGSMYVINEAVNEGAKEIISGLPDSSMVTVTTFNHVIKNSNQMTKQEAINFMNFKEANGTTALYDAILNSIEKEENSEHKVTTIVVITDGIDNASKTNQHELKNKIENFQSKQGMRILFLGSNQDAIVSASNIGIPVNRALTYGYDCENTKNAFRAVSENVECYRSCGVDNFTVAQRQNSVS